MGRTIPRRCRGREIRACRIRGLVVWKKAAEASTTVAGLPKAIAPGPWWEIGPMGYMKRIVLLWGVCVCTGLWCAGRPPEVVAFPEPAIVSRAWAFDFSHSDPLAIAVRDDDGIIQWFWYMTYKVVNNSGAERVFVPEITIATDRGAIFPSRRGVPSYVYDAIKARVGSPLLERPDQMVDKVLRGEDHARESVIIWPARKIVPEALKLNIFFAGLSGETAVVRRPDNGETVVLRRTLMMQYELPGKPLLPKDQPVVPKGERWVMR